MAPFLTLLFIAALSVAQATGAWAGDREIFRTRARSILRSASYQKEIASVREESEEGVASKVLDELGDRISSSRGGELGSTAQAAGSLMRFILILMLVAVGGYAFLFLVSYLLRRKMAAEAKAASLSLRQERKTKERKRFSIRVEELATAGRYKEAVHHMLLIAIHRLSKSCREHTPDFLTSRELVRFLPHTAEERELFKRLVSVVELSLFGGRTVDQESYFNCRDAFQKLAP